VGTGENRSGAAARIGEARRGGRVLRMDAPPTGLIEEMITESDRLPDEQLRDFVPRHVDPALTV